MCVCSTCVHVSAYDLCLYFSMPVYIYLYGRQWIVGPIAFDITEHGHHNGRRVVWGGWVGRWNSLVSLIFRVSSPHITPSPHPQLTPPI